MTRQHKGPGMHIELETREGILLARLSGELDRNTAPELEKQLCERISQGETRIVLDMGGLKYASSAGLRVLLLLGKKTKAANGGVAFCGLQGMVRELFAMAYFDTMFPTADTPDQAAGLLQQKQG